MIRLLYYRSVFSALMVRASDGGVGFCERCGFQYSHRVTGFFVDNYPEPIIEDGARCIDVTLLIREL